MFPEPTILFGGQNSHVDPKTGLSLFGPYSHERQREPWPKSLIVGIVGPPAMVSDAQAWLERCSGVLTNDGRDPFGRPHFPGFRAESAFRCSFVFGDTWSESIRQLDFDRALKEPEPTRRVQQVIQLYTRAIQVLKERDPRPSVILCCIPQDVISSAATSLPRGKGSKGISRAKAKPKASRRTPKFASNQLFLFDELNADLGIEDDEKGHQNLRRGLKAESMEFAIPTQLVWPRTLSLVDSSTPGERLQDIATRAWNFCVALYHKGGGTPWRLADIDPETCFVGVSFYREVLEDNPRLRTAMAQAFTSAGDGYILRGESFEWIKSHRESSPHMSATSAANLMRDVLKLYQDQNKGALPARVVLHKSSRFWEDELEGFRDACKVLPAADFVAFGNRGIQFYRPGQYPPLRGTYIKFSDTEFALYTSGYVPYLKTYPGPRVPRPLDIVEHYGDSPWDLMLREVLALTKMNWNTADFSCSMPITLAFSQRVGQILAEMPSSIQLQNNYRFFM
jgi:hypothetical protein